LTHFIFGSLKQAARRIVHPKVIGRDDESRMDTSSPKEYAMKTLLLGVITATTILGAAPAPAEYREVRIVRHWDRDSDRPHWFRHFAWLGDCRDVTERRYPA
jgi:hypothetical protein